MGTWIDDIDVIKAERELIILELGEEYGGEMGWGNG